MLNVGKTLLCKKSLFDTVFNGERIEYFTEGSYYKVVEVTGHIGADVNSNVNCAFGFVYNEDYNNDHHHSIHGNRIYFRYIWDYFYSDKEIRKNKINKIKNILI